MTRNYIINGIIIFYVEDHRLVKKDDESVDILLNIPASRCLVLLIEREGKIITQKEFFAEVWESHGTYVTQNTFYQNISLLRKCLKTAGLVDDPIKTVPKRGMTLADNIAITLFEVESEGTKKSNITPTQSSPDSARKVSVTHNLLSIHWIYLPLVLLFFISSVYIFNEVKGNVDFFSTYRLYTDVGGCKIMIPNNSKITDIYYDFIKKNIPSCPPNSVFYLSMDREFPRVSVIECDKYIHEEAATCQSSYFIKD